MELVLNHNRIYRAINNCQESFALTVQSLRDDNAGGVKAFLKREILSRIMAVVFPIFASAMLVPKLVVGVFDLGEGLITSMKNKRWNRTIFNNDRAAAYFKSVGLSMASILVGAPASICKPDLMPTFLGINRIGIERKTVKIDPAPKPNLDDIPEPKEKVAKTDPAPEPEQKPKGPIAIKTDAVFVRTMQAEVDVLYDQFEALDQILREEGINYTLCGGSLLGSLRHAGLIPWDDDGDIAIDSKDQEKLLAATEKLNEKGLKLVKHWTGYKVCSIDGKKHAQAEVYNPTTRTWESGDMTFPSVDIFPMDHDEKKGAYFISEDFPDSKKSWPNELFTDAEWNSITDVPFGHLSLKGVSKEGAVAYCTRNYKENWNTVAYQIWDHKNEKLHTRIPVAIVDYGHPVHSKVTKTRIDHKAIAVEALATMTDEQMDKQWQLNKVFGNVHCINLDINPERLVSLKEQFVAVGLDEGEYSRYKACLGREELTPEVWDRVKSNYKRIDTSTPEGKAKLDRQHQGQAGCYTSHYRLIKETAENYNAACKRLWALQKDPTAAAEQITQADAEVKKYSSVLIIEDDTLFGRIRPEDVKSKERYSGVYSDKMTREGTGRIFYEAVRNLPGDWDMLYFMVIPYEEPQRTDSKHLAKLTSTVSSTIAYAVSSHMYPKILQQLSKIDDPTKEFKPVDDEIGELHKTSNSYVIFPAIALHPGEASTINDVEQSDDPDKKFWQCDWGFTEING